MNLLQGNACVVWCHDSQIQSVSFWPVWLLLSSRFLSALQFPQLRYISLQFQLLLLHHCSSVLIITLSCFIFMLFEIFQHGSADWLVLLFIFYLWFMVVQKHLCTNNPYKITKATQTAWVWWTCFEHLYCSDILEGWWHNPGLTYYLCVYVRYRKCEVNQGLLLTGFVSLFQKIIQNKHSFFMMLKNNSSQSTWWAYSMVSCVDRCT